MAATLDTTAAGAPVRATALACTAILGTTPARGTPHTALGSATCRYPTPPTAKGKTLRATIRITLNGTTITKRFTVKLS